MDSNAPPPLREALIEAGLALLGEGGPQALTLRRAAARAGVSHAAPAHHFDGLAGLMTAMAERAFRRFADSMAAARNAAGPDPHARLLSVCDGYLDFARANAGLFHLMFAAPEVDRADPALAAASRTAYGLLRDACAPFGDPRPEVLERAVWSLVHGYASLGGDALAAPASDRAAASPFADLLGRLVPPPAAKALAPRRPLR